MRVVPTPRPRGPRPAAPLALLLWGFLSASSPALAATDPHLQCRLEQGPTVVDVEARTVRDPYRVPPVRINTFRFKAVMVGDAGRVAYIKLYTYYDTPRGAHLLHEVKYLEPRPHAGAGPSGLTGTVLLYEPLLGREFRYGCALVGAAG